jgi:hypothetical protein
MAGMAMATMAAGRSGRFDADACSREQWCLSSPYAIAVGSSFVLIVSRIHAEDREVQYQRVRCQRIEQDGGYTIRVGC